MKTLRLTVLFAGLCCLAFNSGAQVADNGLVAYYSLNGNANDTSGNGNNGTLQNITFSPDRFGNPNGAAFFSGSSSSYISINTTELNLPALTVSVWINPTAGLGSGGPRIISTAGYEITSDAPDGNLNDDVRSIRMNVPTGGTLQSANTIPTGAWTQVVGTWTDQQLNLYIDGQLSASLSTGFPMDYSRGFAPTLGKNSGINYDNYGGLMDDMSVYNYALSAQQVEQLYQIESVPEGSTSAFLVIGLVMFGFQSIRHRQFKSR